MSGWTKGPWETDETRERGRVVYQIAAEDGDAAVTVVSGFRGCVNGKLRAMPQEEDTANARLIAAAPELVEMLEDLLDTSTGAEVTSDEWREVTVEARALLTRVRGKG